MDCSCNLDFLWVVRLLTKTHLFYWRLMRLRFKLRKKNSLLCIWPWALILDSSKSLRVSRSVCYEMYLHSKQTPPFFGVCLYRYWLFLSNSLKWNNNDWILFVMFISMIFIEFFRFFWLFNGYPNFQNKHMYNN